MNQKQSKSYPLKQLTQGISLLILLFILVACGTTSQTGNISEFINGLPSWESVAKLEEPTPEPVAVGEKSAAREELVDGQVYSCQTQTFSMTKNPEEFALYNPTAGTIWPGALIQGKPHLSGSLRLLALDKSRRAPLSIYATGGGLLGVSKGISTTINEPVGSTVSEAINQLIVNAIDSEVAIGAGKSNFQSVESFSGSQTALELGLSGHYLGVDASAKLKYNRSAKEYTYTAYFVQNLFTIAVDQPESPSAFFSNTTTAQDLQQFGINSENLPLYISSVSYGRILMYSFTSSESKEKIKAALEFSYESPAAGVDGYAKAELQETLKNAKVEVLVIGGPETGVKELVRGGNLKSYFEAELKINQVEPISFNLNNLGDNSLAKINDMTEYDVETCTPLRAALPQPTHWWQAENNANDEGGSDTFENNLEYGAGKFGQAFAMNGVDSYIAGYKPSPTLFDTTSPFTISIWINPRSNAGLEVFAAETGPFKEAGQFVLAKVKFYSAQGNMLFFQRRPNSGESSSDSLLALADPVSKDTAPANVWTHVVAVYGGAGTGENNIRLFVNGVKTTTAVYQSNFITDGFVTSDQRTRFGTAGYRKSDVSHRYPFNGLMDEVMTFDRALTDEEIKKMYETFADYK